MQDTPTQEAPATPRYLSTGELLEQLAAAGLPCSRATLYRYLELGLPSHQPGGPNASRRYDWAEVQVWVRNRCSENTAGDEVAA